MSLTLDLAADLEQELSAEAAELGLSLPDYILRLLSAGRGHGPAPKTGPQLIAYWQREGVIGTRPGIKNSQTHARGLRGRAEKRKRG